MRRGTRCRTVGATTGAGKAPGSFGDVGWRDGMVRMASGEENPSKEKTALSRTLLWMNF